MRLSRSSSCMCPENITFAPETALALVSAIPFVTVTQSFQSSVTEAYLQLKRDSADRATLDALHQMLQNRQEPQQQNFSQGIHIKSAYLVLEDINAWSWKTSMPMGTTASA